MAEPTGPARGGTAERHDVAVIGAGLGGLVAALALQQRGVDVALYEQASRLGEVGAGLQLSANAVRVLAHLGVLDELLAVSSLPEGKQVRLWSSGRTWKLFDLGQVSIERYGYPYLMLHRADLHDVLVRALEARAPGSVRLGHRLSHLVESGDGVELRFADGATASAGVVVGADGVHSTVRTHLFGGAEAVSSGHMAWRGVIDATGLPERLRQPVGTNWIGPHGHVIQYPLREGRMVNFVGIVERDDWSADSWSTPGDRDECAADFAGWHPDVLALIESIDTPMRWALKLRPTMERWSSDRITLLGDACHPTLPFLAQGAAMAIEDGMVLARALTDYDDPRRAFAAYEAARVERTAAVVTGSAANAGRFHNPILADREQADDYVSREWAGSAVSDRYEWLFDYDAVDVPV